MLRTYNLREMTWTELTTPGTIDDILAAVAFAMRATIHTSLDATPANLAFSRDMFFPTTYVANWRHIKSKRKKAVTKRNQEENKARVAYKYKVGSKVLISRTYQGEIVPKLAQPHEGPFIVKKVFAIGNVLIQRRGYKERINIRRLRPFRD
jgi:hypothetical protein